MKALNKLLVLTAVICLALVGITGCDGAKGKDKVTVIYDDTQKKGEVNTRAGAKDLERLITSDSPKEIKVFLGEKFLVSLNENPSTGYTWHYRIADEGIIAFAYDDYIHGESNMPGSGGKHYWEFKALKKGSTKIVFSIYRDWEKDKQQSSYEFTVTVR